MPFLMTREEYDLESIRSSVKADKLKMDFLCGDISEDYYMDSVRNCFSWMDDTEIISRDNDGW